MLFCAATGLALLGPAAPARAETIIRQYLADGFDYPVGKQDRYVKTVISRADGPPIKAVWRLRPGTTGAKVIDIAIEGISLMVTKRAEFATVIAQVGIDGLIESLLAKAQPSRSPEIVAAGSN